MYIKYYSGDLFDTDMESLNKAKNNLSNFFFILNFETLNSDIIKLSSLLNLEYSKFEIKNTKKYNQPSEIDLNIIKKYNQLDIKLFNILKKESKI